MEGDGWRRRPFITPGDNPHLRLNQPTCESANPRDPTPSTWLIGFQSDCPALPWHQVGVFKGAGVTIWALGVFVGDPSGVHLVYLARQEVRGFTEGVNPSGQVHQISNRNPQSKCFVPHICDLELHTYVHPDNVFAHFCAWSRSWTDMISQIISWPVGSDFLLNRQHFFFLFIDVNLIKRIKICLSRNLQLHY